MKKATVAEERRAIRRLKSLARVWPETLWLFSGSGTLCVIKKDENGKRVMTEAGGVDQRYVLDHINIENDGGDWD